MKSTKKQQRTDKNILSCTDWIGAVLREDIIRDNLALWKLRQCLDFSTVTRQ